MNWINNLIVVSDTHCGCKFGLCSPGQHQLDESGFYVPSVMQLKVWECWRWFWDEWVPEKTRGEPYAVVVNGDTTDGRHHNSTTQISQNLSDQKNLAAEILAPIVEKCAVVDGVKQFYMIRGTETHVGASGENEEMLAKELGAIPNDVGSHARYELWLRLGGPDGCLCHIMHHIGTTGRTHYESSALMGELGESLLESARWNQEPPDVIIRSHRHRMSKVDIPTSKGDGICIVTPGWQLKTPFVYKIPGGRVTMPQIGGILVRQGDEEHFTRHKVFPLERSKEVVI